MTDLERSLAFYTTLGYTQLGSVPDTQFGNRRRPASSIDCRCGAGCWAVGAGGLAAEPSYAHGTFQLGR